MSQDQLLQLLRAAEASPSLRRRLRLVGSWEQWLALARRLGYRIDADDLRLAERQDQASWFLGRSQLAPIRPLR